MKSPIKALMIAATLALPMAGSVSAMTDDEVMSMGHSMLTGGIYNALKGSGLNTDAIAKLTLGEAALISNILRDGSETSQTKDFKIKKILDTAAERS